MTESQIYTFDNLGADERDHYKGKRIFEIGLFVRKTQVETQAVKIHTL